MYNLIIIFFLKICNSIAKWTSNSYEYASSNYDSKGFYNLYP